MINFPYIKFRILIILKFTIILFLTGILTNNISAQELEKSQIDQLKFRHVGPVGNRIIGVAGISGDPMTYYVGAASGGIWKTTDGGLNWNPIFDDKPVHAIGALTVAPSDPEVVYAGTGETSIRSNVSLGNGIWKSTDAGESWKHMGLDSTGRIGRIVVHPENPDIAFVSALGHAYSPQKQRGIFKTTDGGETWKHVLFVDENTGASDIEMNPENPRILYAAMWQLEMKTWIRISGGKGSGIYMSKDSGESWKKLEGNGLPSKPVGKIALSVTPADSDRVYALIETGDGVPYNGEETESGELWRSDNRGKSWKLVGMNRDMGGRQAYYTHCEASPDNADEIYFMTSGFYTSKDGGVTIKGAGFGTQPNWDHHAMWIDPVNGDRMIVVGDGGLSISQNRGASWLRQQLPVAQLYHVTTDNAIPYNVLTNRQDGPAMKGPSRSGTGGFFGAGQIPSGLWRGIGGGESGFATADPTDPNIIWSSASGRGPLGGIVTRYNEENHQFRHSEVWPEQTTGHPASDVKYRFQWTFPLLISPHDHNTVYVTSQHVHRTTNGGQSWEVISPDLSLNDPEMQGFSGGLTGDNINVEYGNVIYAFEESPVQKGLFWAGTNDGLVHISLDGGENWTNVTSNIPDLPALGVVRNIDASKWDAGKAYMTIEFHQVGNFDPYVYKTEDFGSSWTKITNGIPVSQLSYVRNIKEDPVKPGLLYLGTENALYMSFNDGELWQPLMTNMPHTPMYWIDIQEHFNDMVIGTYGRGIWILDDISPLQQLNKDIVEAKVHLFKPKPVYRFRPVTSIMQFFPEPHFGTDPPQGGTINFWIGEDNDKVEIQITNNQGDTVRTLKHKSKAGLNRVWWNLQGEPSEEMKMHTSPLYADWVPLGKDRSRNSGVGRITEIVSPGTYTVHLTHGDHSFMEEIKVMKDPNSEGSLADINAQTSMVLELKEDLNEVVGMINKIEDIRRQLYDMKSFLNSDKQNDIIDGISKLDSNLIAFESKLIQLKATGFGQDAVRWPVRLAERIFYLADVAATSDFPPNVSQYEVQEVLHNRLTAYKSEFEDLMDTKFESFLVLLKDSGIGPIILPD